MRSRKRCRRPGFLSSSWAARSRSRATGVRDHRAHQHQNSAERHKGIIACEDDENREDSERPESAQALGETIGGVVGGARPPLCFLPCSRRCRALPIPPPQFSPESAALLTLQNTRWSSGYLCCLPRSKRQKPDLKIAFGGGRLYLLGRLDHPTAAMTTFTFAQVVLSLVGIGSGFVVVFWLR